MFITLFLVVSLSLYGGNAHAKRKTLTIEEQYELGQKYLNRGYYIKALEQFNRIRNYHRDDPLSVKAELAIADVYFKKNEWDQARLAYDDFMRMHPHHEELDYVVYKIGQSLQKKAPQAAGRDQTWTRQVVNTWTGFANRYPDSEYLDDVLSELDECRERLARKEMHIASFYRRRKAWNAVVGRAEAMVERYPQSVHVASAMSLLAESYAWIGEAEKSNKALERLRELDPRLFRLTKTRLARVKVEAE